jgi:hypothetical protein
MWALSAKRRAVAEPAHYVSVRWDQAQGATHAVPAFPLALRARPDSARRFCGAERSLCGDASGHQTRPQTWVGERSGRWRAEAQRGPS